MPKIGDTNKAGKKLTILGYGEACGVSMNNPDTAEFVNTTLNVSIETDSYVDKRSGEHKLRNKVAYLLKKS